MFFDIRLWVSAARFHFVFQSAFRECSTAVLWRTVHSFRVENMALHSIGDVLLGHLTPVDFTPVLTSCKQLITGITSLLELGTL